MRTLSATELLEVWEKGERQHPLDKALTLLAVTCPEREYIDLVHLSIGQRDALLLTLRQLSFGPEMVAYAACPTCRAELEFMINTEDLLRSHTPVDRHEHSVNLDGFEIRFRLPDSADLAKSVNSASIEAGKELLRRCVLETVHNTRKVPFEELPEATKSKIVEMIAESDPLSEVRIALNCTECGNPFAEVLDILSFLWEELSGQARQLLRQVHELARYYGWRESDILEMKPWRRQYYLDMVMNV